MNSERESSQNLFSPVLSKIQTETRTLGRKGQKFQINVILGKYFRATLCYFTKMFAGLWIAWVLFHVEVPCILAVQVCFPYRPESL